MQIKRIIAASILLFAGAQARATIVNFDVTNIGGNLWQYDFSVTNNTLAGSLDEFTIFFDNSLFGTLSEPMAPSGWDALVVQAPSILDQDGFYDALATPAPGIPVGASLSGFSLQFVYLGLDTPGQLVFEAIDPNTFGTLDAGLTILPPIPLPAAVWLFASGLIGLVGFSRRKKKGKAHNNARMI